MPGTHHLPTSDFLRSVAKTADDATRDRLNGIADVVDGMDAMAGCMDRKLGVALAEREDI